MFTWIKQGWRKLRILLAPTPAQLGAQARFSAQSVGSRRERALGEKTQWGAGAYDARGAASVDAAMVGSVVGGAVVGTALGDGYNHNWELYGPLDEFSAEQLIDAQLDPDARALQARDAGYEGARDDEELDCACEQESSADYYLDGDASSANDWLSGGEGSWDDCDGATDEWSGLDSW